MKTLIVIRMLAFISNSFMKVIRKIKEKEHELFLKVNRENFNELNNGH